VRKAKVFDSHGCTTNLHHALIDAVMPVVSGNAWKLLCLIARQTDGWNREEIGLSYRDLIAGMGVSSRSTVAAAITELEPLNLLLVKVGKGMWEETRYSLNHQAVIEWQPINFGEPSVTKTVTESKSAPVTEIVTEPPVTKIVPVTKTVTESVTKIGTAPVTKIVPLYRKKQEKQERERGALVSSSVKASPSIAAFVNPNDSFETSQQVEEWSVGERFILKACDLWDKPAVETDWKIKQAVKANGKWVNERVDLKARIGGTPNLFRDFWFSELHRKVNPRPAYVVEQWDAYDRWLIENHEPHRQGRKA
jgi:hypothetical protein